MSKTNKPYKCMYCGERYPTLSHVSICPCDKFSNIPPSENTGNKTVATGEQVGVVDSVGDALFSLTHADFRTIQKALLCYHQWTDKQDFCFGVDDEDEKQQSLKNIARLRNLFINAEGYTSFEHQAWIKACENGFIHAESGIFDKAE